MQLYDLPVVGYILKPMLGWFLGMEEPEEVEVEEQIISEEDYFDKIVKESDEEFLNKYKSILGNSETEENKPIKVEVTNSNQGLDDIVKDFDIFVDRKEDKLDTEPKEWNEYIGQEGAKETIRETIQAVKNDISLPYPHILINGFAGSGKSALIHLLAIKSGLPLIETVGGNLEEARDVYKLLEKLPKKPPYGIIFIDEIHSIKKELGELLLPAVQMFKVCNKPIPYFTLAGATTDTGTLTEKLSPLVDRCKQKFDLKPYKNEELAKILKNVAKKKKLDIGKDALLEIASRSRNTPRLAIGNLDNIYYYVKYLNKNFISKEDVIKKLEKLEVFENGVTSRDIKLLRYLAKQETPLGQNTLEQKMNVDKKTYSNNIEPFLVRRELVVRTPRGRIISNRGRELLKKLKEECK